MCVGGVSGGGGVNLFDRRRGMSTANVKIQSA